MLAIARHAGLFVLASALSLVCYAYARYKWRKRELTLQHLRNIKN